MMNVGHKHSRKPYDHSAQSWSIQIPRPPRHQTALEESGQVMYNPSRMLPPPNVVNSPRPCAKVNVSDHYRFGPDTNHHASYHQKYFSQDEMRFEADNMPQFERQPYQRDNKLIFATTNEMWQEKPNSAAPRNDPGTRSLWRPEDEERFGGSNHYGLGPTTNSHARESEYIHQDRNRSKHYGSGPDTKPHADPESEYIHQDRRRLKIDHGVRTMVRQPCPIYLPEVSHQSENFQRYSQRTFATTHELRQEKPNLASSRNDPRPRPLWRSEDGERFGGSNYYGHCPTTNIHVHESEYVHQDRMRLKFDEREHTMARQPCPIYHPEVSYPSERGFQRENQHFFRQEKPNLDASRNDVRRRPLSHPEDEKRFSVSDHYGSGPTVNSHIKPESEYTHQDRKRLKVVDGKCTTVRQPSPSYQAQAKYPSEHGVYPVVGEPKKENPDSSNGKLPHLLYLPEDEEHLTELHCFVRKHCVFIFCATKKHVGTPRRGRKKALRLGQIGIGCLYCRSISAEDKLKGSTYFPTCISGIYNATMIIQQRHFPVCPSVSREDFCKYTKLKGLTARSASTKEYWISAAKKKGLVDTSSGELRASVFFRSSDNVESSASRLISIPQDAGRSHVPLVCLVEPADRVFATEYSFFVIEQMTTCEFTEADRLGKRKCHKLGFPGMACRHCYGCNGSGRFFPLTLKTFSDVSKSINVLRNHLLKCTRGPSWMAETVSMLYERHKVEKMSSPFGSQKIFFDLIWRRLHPELPLDEGEETGNPHEKIEAKAPPRQRIRPSRERGPTKSDAPQAYDSITTTPLPPIQSPPIVHRGIIKSHQVVCPKKRYLYSHSDNDVEQHHCHPDLTSPPLQHQPSPPLPLQQVTTSFSDSDFSIAMILANGFGRDNNDMKEDSPEGPRRAEV